MDLISREKAIVQLSHNKTGNDDSDVVIQHDIATVQGVPSAFEGMTNGEVIKAVFGGYLGIDDEQIEKSKYIVSISPKGKNSDPFIAVKRDFWNSPYKGVSK